MVSLYRWNGKLLVKNGKFAIHERCCCEDEPCPCIGCAVCPEHCLTIEQLRLSWGRTGCACPYVQFEFPPSAFNPECLPDPLCPSGRTCADNVDNGKNCDWIEECKWRLYGQWSCLVDPDGFGFPSLGFSNCGTVIAEAVNATTWKFTVESGPVGCMNSNGNVEPACVTEVSDPDGTVTLDITQLPANLVDTICETPVTNIEFGPNSANANVGSSPNNCFADGDITWNASECCPTADGSGSGSGSGGGGSDPLGCCTNADYTTTPDTTQANCEAGGGYWQAGDCSEGYP